MGVQVSASPRLVHNAPSFRTRRPLARFWLPVVYSHLLRRSGRLSGCTASVGTSGLKDETGRPVGRWRPTSQLVSDYLIVPAVDTAAPQRMSPNLGDFATPADEMADTPVLAVMTQDHLLRAGCWVYNPHWTQTRNRTERFREDEIDTQAR